MLVRAPVSAGTGPYCTACQSFSAPVVRVTTSSLNAKLMPATATAVASSGARIWCAESPAARIAIVSEFWFSGKNVNSAASSTE